MNKLCQEDATRLLVECRDELAASVTDALLQQYPDIERKFGPRGRESTREDLNFHIDQLQAALECGDSSIFHEYILWTASVLEARQIDRQLLISALELMIDYLGKVSENYSAAQATQVLHGAIGYLDEPETGVDLYQSHLSTPHPETDTLAAMLIEGRRADASVLMDAVHDEAGSYVEVALQLVQPAMYLIGELWQRNEITVAREHLATAIMESLLARAYARSRFNAPSGRRALFACVPGNRHSMGLRMVADAYEMEGWEVQYLGADTPVAAIIAQAREFNPDLIGLSISMPQHLHSARVSIEQLHQELGETCPRIIVGGLTLNRIERLWTTVGADKWALNAQQALEISQ